MKVRYALMLRQLVERSQWSVNATKEVLLSIPHCSPSRPSGLEMKGGGYILSFDDGSTFQVPVPAFVKPFLSQVATVLVVTFRRTNIVNEIDIFVTRGETVSGGDANA